MYIQFIARAERRDDRTWRQDGNIAIPCDRCLNSVAVQCPRPRHVTPFQEDRRIHGEHSAPGKVAEPRLKRDLASSSIHSRSMQGSVNVRGSNGARSLPRSGSPACSEPTISVSPALRTWAMPRRKRGGFIEEKQLGVIAGTHQFATTASERQQADDPRSRRPAAPPKSPGSVVKATAISHQRAARRREDDVTVRCCPVLQGHGS